MSAKTFGKAVLIAVAAGMAALAALVAVCDPFFQLRAPGEAAVYGNERYENPGLIQNLDYDTIIMGTSLACNYRASWFDRLTGGSAIKIGYRDGYISEFDRALELAFQTHPQIREVYFGMDLNILLRPDSSRTVELPGYLYDTHRWNDAAYFFNMDVYLRCLRNLNQLRRGGGTTLDEAYVWDGSYTFSRETALANYGRPAVSDRVMEEDAYFGAVDENVAVLRTWLEEHPGTQFTFFLSPYSILYWDYAIREGTADARLAALDRALDGLLDCENLRVCCFLGETRIITDLNNYTDYIHISGDTTRRLAEKMTAGECRITRENKEETLSALREFLAAYDYEGIFST